MKYIFPKVKMSREIKVGDFVNVSGPNLNQTYIIRNVGSERIYISTEQDPNRQSLLVGSGNLWNVYGTNIR